MGIQIRELADWARHRKVFATLLVVVTLSIGILIGTVISSRGFGSVVATRRGDQNGTAAAPLAVPEPVQLSSVFATIAKQVEPAVVNISTAQQASERRRTPTPRTRPRVPDPFQDFFDRFFDYPEQDQPSRSLGSGVIVDKRGYILTNHHVVEQATKIQVKLYNDPTRYSAKLVGADPETDLAVIKIEANRDLPTAKLGNSEAVQVGDWVLAFGSPFSLEATVTAGIISAKDRGNITGQQFQRFLQTDAAINPGNSGGPLVNMAGEVIGINTAIYTTTRGFDGVGFAMPSNTAIQVYNQLAASGRVTRGSIGIVFEEGRSNNPITLKALGAPYGMIVEDVTPGSPADKAGLQAGDVITSVNGQAVRTGSDLVNPIVATPIGQKVRVTYIRDHKPHEAAIAVEDRTKLFPERAGRTEERPEEAAPAEFGLRVEDLTPELARRIGIEGRRGVVVTQVEPTSFAEDLGFRRGDVISEVNRQAIGSVSEYRAAVGALKAGQNVVFKVYRRSDDRILTVFLAGMVPESK